MNNTKMKKQILFLAALFVLAIGILLLSILLYQRKRQNEDAAREAMKDTLYGFLQALDDGDVATAKGYCSDDAASALGLSFLDADTFQGILTDALGLNDDLMTDEIASDLDALTAAQKKIILTDTDYDTDLLEVEKQDGETTGKITVTLSGTGNLYAIDYATSITKANESLASYVAENQTTLMNVYDKKGKKVLKRKLKRQEISELLTRMAKRTKKVEPQSRTWELTITLSSSEKNEDGTPVCVISNAILRQSDE